LDGIVRVYERVTPSTVNVSVVDPPVAGGTGGGTAGAEGPEVGFGKTAEPPTAIGGLVGTTGATGPGVGFGKTADPPTATGSVAGTEGVTGLVKGLYVIVPPPTATGAGGGRTIRVAPDGGVKTRGATSVLDRSSADWAAALLLEAHKTPRARAA
jgi:hypothetical protein